ncbi:MAG: hypothetical protein ACTXOO_05005 [Sodalis sp. (in: enterobacteria)]
MLQTSDEDAYRASVRLSCARPANLAGIAYPIVPQARIRCVAHAASDYGCDFI